MRVWIKYIFVLLLTIAVVSPRPVAAQAPPTPAAEPGRGRAELALGYSYLRSNAPPGGCACFNLNGGNANFTWPVRPGKFAFVADLTIENVGNVNSSNQSLTLGAFTMGARYLPHMHHSPLQPFGEVLAGFAHASGSLSQAPNPLAGNATLAFAGVLGGGVDLHINRRFGMRLAEADYLPTTFDNGSNNHQNNFRLAAGVVIRF